MFGLLLRLAAKFVAGRAVNVGVYAVIASGLFAVLLSTYQTAQVSKHVAAEEKRKHEEAVEVYQDVLKERATTEADLRAVTVKVIDLWRAQERIESRIDAIESLPGKGKQCEAGCTISLPQ